MYDDNEDFKHLNDNDVRKVKQHYHTVMALFHSLRKDNANNHITDRELFHSVAIEMKFKLNGKDRPLNNHGRVWITGTPDNPDNASFVESNTCYHYCYEPYMHKLIKQLDLTSEYPYWSVHFNGEDGRLYWSSICIG